MSGAEERFLRADEVMRRTCLSRSTLYRGMRDGSFPRPFKISRRLVAWKLSEVLAWIHRDATVGARGDRVVGEDEATTLLGVRAKTEWAIYAETMAGRLLAQLQHRVPVLESEIARCKADLEAERANLEAERAKARKSKLLSVAWPTYQVLAERVRDRLARIEQLTPVDVAEVTWGDVGTLTEVESQLSNIVGFLEGNANGR